jgi:4-hydroxy-L-threonine phosphate dehydrogenase PdxA
MTDTTLPLVALSTGDPAGIGPELCMKAALSEDVRSICRPVIFGDPAIMKFHADSCGIGIQLDGYKAVSEINWSSSGVKIIELDLFGNKEFRIGEINGDNGKAAIDCGAAAIQAAVAGDVRAVVAAPQTEKSVHLAGIEFDGYPSFVARQTGLAPDDVYLMVCFDKYRIAHCTLHSSVRQSLDMITEDRVRHIIGAVNETLIKIGIDKPKILVTGLNPHASEDGLFGSEEAEIIEPAIAAMKAHGLDVDGPIAADLMLHEEGYDAFIVMLHDQGHIPAKMLAKHRTAGLSIGSPILFSSVAHGSAHDIAGKGVAEPTAVIEAIRRLVG